MKTKSNTSYSLRPLPRRVHINTYILFSRAFQRNIDISTVHVVVSIAIPNQANTTMYSNTLETKRNDYLIINNNIHTDRYIGRVHVTSHIYTFDILQIPIVTAKTKRNVFDAGYNNNESTTANNTHTYIHTFTKKEIEGKREEKEENNKHRQI